MKKRCRQCEAVKNIGRFYKSALNADGYMNTCKQCHKQNVTENQEAKADYYRAKRREISARPYYVQQRDRYNKSERGRQVNRETKLRRRRFEALEARA